MSRQSSPAGLQNEPATLSERVVSITASGTTTLNKTDHANRLILVGNAASGVTLKLPTAEGSGDVYRVLNTVARTSGSLLFQLVSTASTFNVMVNSLDSTAVATDTSSWFSTNATQISLNITTTGGLGGDYFEFVDGAAGQWYVRGQTRCSGDKATPLS
jgi:hypothetical protein